MSRPRSLLLTLLLATAALAGCTGGDTGEDTTPTPTTTLTDPTFPTPGTPTPATPTPATPTPNATLDSSTYALAAAGTPTQVKPGAKLSFTLFVNGSVTHESDHIGAHFADNDTTDPPAEGRKDCEHVAGALPGSFLVNCTMHDTGTWYVWGHARINDSGELRNWWTPDAAIVRVRDYNLTLGSVPTNAQTSGSNFTVQLNVSAIADSDNASSDHIGIHYWNASEPNPTVQNSAGACAHVADSVVGTHTITCNIDNERLAPHDYALRGHVRISEGGTTLEWWSQEYTVSVLGSLPVG